MNTEERKLFSITKDALESLQLLKAALDSSITGIVITDNSLPDNPIVYCNESFERLTGYGRDEIIGRNCRFLQAKDRKQAQRDYLKKAIEAGDSCKVELRNYKKDGTLFWNELYLSPIKNEEGRITHFIGVQHDITDRKKAEHDLQYEKEQIEKIVQKRTHDLNASHEYLNSILQTVRESLVVLDPSYNVLSVNNHFLTTFKVNASETQGKSLYELGNGQWNIKPLKDLIEGILPTSNPVLGFEVDHEFPHIGRKLMLLNAYRIELEGEFKDRILLAIEDITDKRAIEQRKDDFLSVASHELKTPLTTIKGYVQLIQRLLPPTSSQKLKDVLNTTAIHIDRLNQLVKDLLDVSRIQTGNASIHADYFNVNKMVEEVIEGLKYSITSHKIHLNGQVDQEVYGDEAQLSQVVINLISNAIKYSPKADCVDISLSKVSDYLKVSVTDYGVGISQADQEKIFQRFYRVGAVQKHFPGMGIGLYICQQIIEQHFGYLWVESEEGKGSTFSFTLPFNASTADGE